VVFTEICQENSMAFSFFQPGDFRLKDVIIHEIYSFLSTVDVARLSQTNKTLSNILHERLMFLKKLEEKRNFYLPLLEGYSDRDLKSSSSWGVHGYTPCMVISKKFYLDVKSLFSLEKEARGEPISGCYVVPLSCGVILKSLEKYRSSYLTDAELNSYTRAELNFYLKNFFIEDKKNSYVMKTQPQYECYLPIEYWQVLSYIRNYPRKIIKNPFFGQLPEFQYKLPSVFFTTASEKNQVLIVSQRKK